MSSIEYFYHHDIEQYHDDNDNDVNYIQEYDMFLNIFYM